MQLLTRSTYKMAAVFLLVVLAGVTYFLVLTLSPVLAQGEKGRILLCGATTSDPHSGDEVSLSANVQNHSAGTHGANMYVKFTFYDKDGNSTGTVTSGTFYLGKSSSTTYKLSQTVTAGGRLLPVGRNEVVCDLIWNDRGSHRNQDWTGEGRPVANAIVTVKRLAPDLVVNSIGADYTNLRTGDSFSLAATVRNQGSGASGSTTLRYYRSSNSTISTSDTPVGTDSVSGLSANTREGASIDLKASVTGTFYYGACVDSVAGESNTENNCSIGVQVTIENPPTAPDLVVNSINAGNRNLLAGDTFKLSATVRNQGSGTSGRTTLRYYRSTNSTISTSDTRVGTDDDVSGLSANTREGASIDLKASVTGTFYYGACVDSVAGESNTGNNCSSGVQVTIEDPPTKPTFDLTWSVSKSEVQSGESFELTVHMNDVSGVGQHGGISVSFPSLTAANTAGSPSDYTSEQGDVFVRSSTPSLGTAKFHSPGEIIYDDLNQKMTAGHLLFETDASSSQQASEGTLKLRITPKLPGDFRFRVRGWICANEYSTCSRQPSVEPSGRGDIVDQQGWPAHEKTIAVMKDDQGGGRSNAILISTSDVSATEGTIEAAGEVDYFQFQATKNIYYTIEAEPVFEGLLRPLWGLGLRLLALTNPWYSDDLVLTLQDSEGRLIRQDIDSGISKIEWRAGSSGTHYIAISAKGVVTARKYRLTLDADDQAVERKQLAEKFAPVLRIHPDEKFLPQGVEALIGKALLKYDEGDGGGTPIVTINSVTLDMLAPEVLRQRYMNAVPDGPEYDGSNWYLDVPNDKREEPQTEHPPKVYATIQDHIPGKVYLQYYLFYYYDHLNPGFSQNQCERLLPRGTPFIGDKCTPHEADWELIQLEFEADKVRDIINDDSKPARVAYSQHGWSEDSDYDDIPVIDGHPVAYVALGKHANFFGPDPDIPLLPSLDDPWSLAVTQDDISDSGKELLPPALSDYSDPCPSPDHHACTYTYELALIDKATSWVAFEGTWGDSKVDGPDSPDRWDNPDDWMETIPIADVDYSGSVRDFAVLKAAFSHWGWRRVGWASDFTNTTGGRVTELTFSDQLDANSPGTIPPSLGDLSHLERLDISGNGFTGNIPRQLGYLANLETLLLSGNQLTGCIPDSLRDVPANDFADLGLPFCSEEPPASASAVFHSCTTNGRTSLTVREGDRVNLKAEYTMIESGPEDWSKTIAFDFFDGTQKDNIVANSSVESPHLFTPGRKLIAESSVIVGQTRGQWADTVLLSPGKTVVVNCFLHWSPGKGEDRWHTASDDGHSTIRITVLPAENAGAEELQRTARRLRELQSSSFDLNHVVGSTTFLPGIQIHRAYGEVAAPGNFVVTVEAKSLFSRTDLEIGLMSIDGVTQMTNVFTGEWGEVSPDTLPFDFSDFGGILAHIVEQVRTPVLLGQESMGGREVYRIGGTIMSEDLRGLVPTAATGYPVALELLTDRDTGNLIEVKITGQVVATDDPESQRLLTISDLNQPVQRTPLPSTPPLVSMEYCVRGQTVGDPDERFSLICGGRWSSEVMSTNRPGHYANYFTFTLDRNATMRVVFDRGISPYMYLLEGKGADGQVLVAGQGMGCYEDSQLRRERGQTPTYPVTYTIEATTFDPRVSGDFTIRLYVDGTASSC